ncbi:MULTISPECIES: DNA-directed RNA polymerase subunit omega [Psychrilyobacter]|uniref:DNA-directed RNA polymerase subunit omega n=1 Tax=Psychrilyobacter piezotolerans TaxID=2293438 RepID=A0ABX9KEG2_9FUSO|nr:MULTISPECIES: DNA-directed RNA polymerase subunit omega [Psychrilyobacter]MCS5422721.1 DNA-directed RNA polymerase subunit omega [Psychrilyobacter sp. S5]NDI78991.1 DNA-directed RNA polymerase subunit omega [Psychrilyobacter piezotolerans]RDE59212.1 DNA-directed RNA polymerase subunit omega [Psychrilyobacter sp. S5]REI39779.1 DNA-directed RNA polymerase subunit omega [Psychrilyobacter piezotolerans]
MKKKVTYDELLEKIPNKYKLAMTLGKRYGQIVAGEPLLVKPRKKDTIAEIASREVLEEKVQLVRGKIEG